MRDAHFASDLAAIGARPRVEMRRRLSGATHRRQQHNYRDSCPVSHDRSDITARVAMVSVRVLTASRCWRRFQLLWQLATAEALHFKRFARSHDPQHCVARSSHESTKRRLPTGSIFTGHKMVSAFTRFAIRSCKGVLHEFL